MNKPIDTVDLLRRERVAFEALKTIREEINKAGMVPLCSPHIQCPHCKRAVRVPFFAMG